MISYKPLITYLESKGYSVNYLRRQKLINATTAQQIRDGDAVSLRVINSICQHLKLPIEKVVEIKLDKSKIK